MEPLHATIEEFAADGFTHVEARPDKAAARPHGIRLCGYEQVI
jgi:hypothetical protein